MRESWILASVLLVGCIDQQAVDISGKNCPCSDGFQCIDGLCLRGTSPGGFDGGAAVDAAGGVDAGGAVDGGATDANLGSDTGAVDAGGMSFLACVEAEDGTISAPMMTQANGDASGGNVVTVAAGTAALTVAPGDADMGRVTLNVMVDAMGTYRVWGRVLAPTMNNDSFWVRVDGGAWNEWNQLAGAAALEWDQVHNTVMDMPQEQEFMLTAGMHTIDVHYREEGALLDKVLVTDDLGLTPTGNGCP